MDDLNILTGENLSSIQVANMNLIYWPVRSSRRKRADRVNAPLRVEGGVSLFYSAINIIRVHGNLVQPPSNFISIFKLLNYICIAYSLVLSHKVAVEH